MKIGLDDPSKNEIWHFYKGSAVSDFQQPTAYIIAYRFSVKS